MFQYLHFCFLINYLFFLKTFGQYAKGDKSEGDQTPVPRCDLERFCCELTNFSRAFENHYF